MPDENGTPPELPTIKVAWDAEKQAPSLGFETSEFKTWDMVVMVLEAAKSYAEFNRNMQRAQLYQEKAIEQHRQQMSAAQLAQQLRGKIH